MITIDVGDETSVGGVVEALALTRSGDRIAIVLPGGPDKTAPGRALIYNVVDRTRTAETVLRPVTVVSPELADELVACKACSAAFSLDGAYLAVTRRDDAAAAEVFDARTGVSIGTTPGVGGRIPRGGHAPCLAFSPDGRLLAVGGTDGTCGILQVGDPEAGMTLIPLPEEDLGSTALPIWDLAFSSDGSYLALLGGRFSKVLLVPVANPYDVQCLAESCRIGDLLRDATGPLNFDDAGRKLLVAAMTTEGPNLISMPVAPRDQPRGAASSPFQPDDGWPNGITGVWIDPKGRSALFASYGMQLGRYNPRSGRICWLTTPARFRMFDEPFVFAISGDGRVVARARRGVVQITRIVPKPRRIQVSAGAGHGG